MNEILINSLLKSICEQDEAPIVVCDIEHTIVYMNPAAEKNYEKRGGNKILGQSLFNCHNNNSCEIIKKVVAWFNENSNNNKVHTFYNSKHDKDIYMVALRDESRKLIGYYEKHEFRTKDETAFYEMN